MTANDTRHDWTREEIRALFALPFNDLVYRAQTVHRAHFAPNEVQISTLLSIKTGGCPEDCAYCPQAARYHTGVEASKLMEKDAVLAEARSAKDSALRAFAWARRGARPRTAISTRCASLSKACAPSGSKPAPRWACSPRPRPRA